MIKISTGASLWILAMNLVISGQAHAQAEAKPSSATTEPAGGEIIVTAERRESTLAKTPIAITALSGDVLKQNNIVTTSDLQNIVPAMQIGSFGPITRITLRGVGMENFAGGNIGGDSGVSFAVNGVLYTRPQMFTPGFMDVKRIEVLRGPQGTLYGRNAIGGSVNVVTNGPTDTLDGYANVALGSRSLVRVEAAVGGPVAGDMIEARAAFRFNKDGGDLKNLDTGGNLNALDERQGRLMIDIMPGRPFNVELSGDYYQNRGSGIADEQLPSAIGLPLPGVQVGGVYDVTRHHTDVNNDGFNRSRIWGTSARLNGDLGFADTALTLSYRHMWSSDGGDLDGTTGLFANSLGRVNKSHNETAEWTITSKPESRLQWVAGLLYLHEIGIGAQDFQLFTFGTDFLSGGVVRTNSYAAYAQGTYPILDNLKLTAGLRYSSDRKSGTEYVDFQGLSTNAGAKTWHALTPRFTLDWNASSTTMVYATIARGYKSGGFNIGALQQPYNPEYVWDYEGGIKLRLFHNRLSLSATGYHYDYSNMQEERIVGLVATLQNASKSTINGAELEAALTLTPSFTITGTYGFSDAKFGTFLTSEDEHPELGLQDLAGRRVPNTPRNTLDVGATYVLSDVLPGRLSVHGDVSYRSKTYFSPFNREYLSQGNYAIANARVSYAFGTKGFTIAAFARNLTNKRAYIGGVVNSALLAYTRDVQLNRGRQIGIEAGYSF